MITWIQRPIDEKSVHCSGLKIPSQRFRYLGERTFIEPGILQQQTRIAGTCEGLKLLLLYWLSDIEGRRRHGTLSSLSPRTSGVDSSYLVFITEDEASFDRDTGTIEPTLSTAATSRSCKVTLKKFVSIE